VIRVAIKYRNFLSHAYHLIDDAKVYGIAVESVPLLLQAIDNMLKRVARPD
jgi:uncharacterized protein YutE (UPF0331/DUF86 family)